MTLTWSDYTLTEKPALWLLINDPSEKSCRQLSQHFPDSYKACTIYRDFWEAYQKLFMLVSEAESTSSAPWRSPACPLKSCTASPFGRRTQRHCAGESRGRLGCTDLGGRSYLQRDPQITVRRRNPDRNQRHDDLSPPSFLWMMGSSYGIVSLFPTMHMFFLR